MASFSVPLVHVNESGWGPEETNVPDKYRDVPFAPFGKGDRLGRAADFTASAYSARYQRYRDRTRDENAVNDEFQYKHDSTEDSTFELIDSAKTKKFNSGGRRPAWRGGRGRFGRGRGGRGGRDEGGRTGGPGGRGNQQAKKKRNDPRGNDWRARDGRGRGGRGGRGGRWGNRQAERQASVKVHADWEVLEELDLPQFNKLQANKPTAEDIKWCGHLDSYNEAYDRITSKTPKPLQRIENKEFYYVSTTDDPIIEQIVVEAGEAEEGITRVYATDAILAHLMASSRSVYPWDIVVQKMGGQIFFDKRDDSQFDYLTVSETAYEPPAVSEDADAINTPEKLSLEASVINQNFTQQILHGEKGRQQMDDPNPFYDEEESPGMEPASVAFRYRKFTFPGIELVVRCELHGTVTKRGEKQYMTAYALNEWDSKHSAGIEWRQKIDQQRGAVLATELKNNSCKLAKWTCQSMIAGADQMKIGYVSRKGRTDPHHHQILATQFYKPQDFSMQINLSVLTMWGVFKMFADKFIGMDDGKYVIMKDPNKAVVRIYSVPIDTFEEDDEEEEEEEEGDDRAAAEN